MTTILSALAYVLGVLAGLVYAAAGEVRNVLRGVA